MMRRNSTKSSSQNDKSQNENKNDQNLPPKKPSSIEKPFLVENPKTSEVLTNHHFFDCRIQKIAISVIPSNHRYFNPCFDQIQTRSQSIQLIWQLCNQLNLSDDVYYQSVVYLDNLLSQKTLSSLSIKPTCIAIVSIATKFIEPNFKIHQIFKIVKKIDFTLDPDQLLEYELGILRVLDYKISSNSPFYVAINMVDHIFHSELNSQINKCQPDYNEQMLLSIQQLLMFFIELGTTNYNFNQFSSFTVAMAALLSTRVLLSMPSLNSVVLLFSKGFEQDISECICLFVHQLKINHEELYINFSLALRLFASNLSKSRNHHQFKENVQKSKIVDFLPICQFESFFYRMKNQVKDNERFPFHICPFLSQMTKKSSPLEVDFDEKEKEIKFMDFSKSESLSYSKKEGFTFRKDNME